MSAIGWAMVAAVFVAQFVAIWMKSGIKDALVVFGVVAAVVGWIAAGIFLALGHL
jgi:hypothetical protein